MPRVEGMEANHVQTMFGDGAAVELQHLVHVLVVAPGEHELRNAAARLVHAVLRAKDRVGIVWILAECLRKDDSILGRGTADWKGVSHHSPLRQGVLARHLRQGHDFAKVVQEPHQMEPVVLLPRPLLTNSLGGLEVVNAVGDVHIRVRVVHEIVEHSNHLHHRELPLGELQPRLLLLPHKIHRLISVHQAVGCCHLLLARGVLVVAEAIAEHVLARYDLP
mmetsp:Transcript_125127/g.296885  ORF Transcript_125127/g.296885 Transcript_125127/m.296885 type:complete len:221 (-) Transcript_125127:1146-1808(-)